MQVILTPILVILTVMIFGGFIVVAQSVVFWIPNSEEVSDTLFEFMLGPSLYPNSSYIGAVRFFFTFFVPALLISGIPVNILLEPNVNTIILMIGIALLWIFLAISIFKIGLKRYESGNLVGSR
jgi:ABC-2 type transport system permease protein